MVLCWWQTGRCGVGGGGALEPCLRGRITKSGPRFFWQAAECEIYRISYVAGAAAFLLTPMYCQTVESWKMESKNVNVMLSQLLLKIRQCR